MNLTLIQLKQNALYQFGGEQKLTKQGAASLQAEMLEQNFFLLTEAAKENPDLLVTTEAVNFAGLSVPMHASLIPEVSDAVCLRFSALAKTANAYLIAGLIRKEKQNGEYRFYNSALVFDRTGAQIQVYDKIHLAGEENNCLTPGTRFCVVETDFGKVGICICWDAQMPETARILTLQGADLLVCPTWGWESTYGCSLSYLNGIFTAAAMSVPYQTAITGIRRPSEIIDPYGHVLAQGSFTEKGIVTAEIDLSVAKTVRQQRLQCRKPDLYIGKLC